LDATICVACSAAMQQERLRARGWLPGQIEQRLAAQWPIERKMERANYLIWSEAGLDVHAAQVDRILRLLMQQDRSTARALSPSNHPVQA